MAVSQVPGPLKLCQGPKDIDIGRHKAYIETYMQTPLNVIKVNFIGHPDIQHPIIELCLSEITFFAKNVGTKYLTVGRKRFLNSKIIFFAKKDKILSCFLA